MSQHPYPEHVVEAVAKRMAKQRFIQETFDELSDHDKKSLANDAGSLLQALWDAGRVNSVEELESLPHGAWVESREFPGYEGYFISIAHKDVVNLPSYVVYWGDRDA